MAMTSNRNSSDFNFYSILEKNKQGHSKDYDWLTSRLSDPDIETSELQIYIRDIRKNIIYLEREYEIFVGLLLKLNWTARESSFIKEYQGLLLNLISAHTYYLKAVLRMLVKHFNPPVAPVTPVSESTDISVDDIVRQKHDVMFVNVHLVLKAITQIVPMTPKVLMPLLSDLLPFFMKDIYIQECFIKNLLQVTHYLPKMRQKIMEIVIDRLLKFDVRSPRQEIEELERPDEENMEDDDIVFEMDDPSIQKEIISPVDSSKITCEEPIPMTHKEANKLDVLMDITFKYIKNICYSEDELDWEATKLLYRELLLIFERLILPTRASCHVQFVMFYISSLKQPICDGFLDYLWKQVQNPIVQPIFRQKSVCYMGSLLSRGLFVSVRTVKACLELMCDWIHKYLDQTNASSYADITHHGPFYAVVQAVLYVFVFRNKDIFETCKGVKWSLKLNFQRIVTSRLNPLKVCLPVIVQTFASIARSHQLAFCDTIIERNNRQILPTVTSDDLVDSGGRLLDSYFPFDPYILHRSGKYVLPLYREFQGSIEEEDNIEENEEDDFIKEEIVSPSSTKIIVGSLSKKPSDFMEYGVSPGFKHFHDMT